MKHKINRSIFLGLISIFLALAVSSCGGSGNSGTGTRNLTGTMGSIDTIPSSSESSAMMTFSDQKMGLDGVTVIATATDGTTVTTQTDANGGFTLPLQIGQSYVVSFAEGNMFIGTLIVSLDQAGNFKSRGFQVTDGPGDIDLGRVICSAGLCSAEINPNCELDDNDDGIANCDDDGFKDRHPDFDHDGICDDEQGEDHHHHGDNEECEVTDVSPFNGEIGVALNERIDLHFSNAIDPASLDATSFFLSDATGVVVTTTIVEDQDLKHHDENHEVELLPSSPLAPLTSYTIHLLGTVQCLNGHSPLGDMEINFTTGTASE